ncbi:peptidase S51 dipeptidase E, partial [Micromonospora sp. NPDC047753]
MWTAFGRSVNTYFVPLQQQVGAENVVDFTLYPHLNHPDMEDTELSHIEKWAAGIPVPTYAIDDNTAITVVEGSVEVISEGDWRLINP